MSDEGTPEGRRQPSGGDASDAGSQGIPFEEVPFEEVSFEELPLADLGIEELESRIQSEAQEAFTIEISVSVDW
jgi:hypothetical protein